MASDNTVTLVGNITEDPELRFTPSGRAVASFTVAVNRRFKGQSGEWEDKLDGFFRCSCWADMAENVSESLTKGVRVVVTGRLQQRSWEDKEGGKRSTIEIQVDEVGPSLRWATAAVQKSNRSSGRQSAGAPTGSAGRPAESGAPTGDWGTPASVGRGSSGRRRKLLMSPASITLSGTGFRSPSVAHLPGSNPIVRTALSTGVTNGR